MRVTATVAAQSRRFLNGSRFPGDVLAIGVFSLAVLCRSLGFGLALRGIELLREDNAGGAETVTDLYFHFWFSFRPYVSGPTLIRVSCTGSTDRNEKGQ